MNLTISITESLLGFQRLIRLPTGETVLFIPPSHVLDGSLFVFLVKARYCIPIERKGDSYW